MHACKDGTQDSASHYIYIYICSVHIFTLYMIWGFEAKIAKKEKRKKKNM
jgi:hypothetical protein